MKKSILIVLTLLLSVISCEEPNIIEESNLEEDQTYFKTNSTNRDYELKRNSQRHCMKL